MPTLLVWNGYRFRFYSSDRPEPPHVHIVKGSAAARIWLRSLDVEFSRGYNEYEMRELMRIVADNRDAWIGKWNDLFGV